MRTFRDVGVPSSSTLSEPRRFGIVPSSTTVTSSEATFWPMRPAKAEVPLRLKSPSRPCPIASCRRMPGQPGPNTTVIEPAGAATAPSLSTAWRAAGGDRLLGQGVEIVRPTPARKRERSGGTAPVRDRAGLPCGLLEVLDRDLVGVGIAGPGSGLRAHPGSLAHVARGLFDNPLFEYQLFVDTVLEVNIGVVHL